MKPIEPAELSAYMDGELEPARKSEVESALHSDASLRAALERLNGLDRAWTSAARSAISLPNRRIGVAENPPRAIIRFAALLIFLLVVRFVPKFGDFFLFGVALHVLVLVITLGWVIRSRDEASCG